MKDLVYFRLVDWDGTGNDIIDRLIKEITDTLVEDLKFVPYSFNINMEVWDLAPVYYITSEKSYLEELGIYKNLLDCEKRGVICLFNDRNNIPTQEIGCYPEHNSNSFGLIKYLEN